MSIVSIATKAALLGALVLTVQVADIAAGGDLYLASLSSQLAQSDGSSPPPPLPPPPSGGDSFGAPAPSFGGETPPPPTRPINPIEGQSGSPGMMQSPPTGGGDFRYPVSGGGFQQPPAGGAGMPPGGFQFQPDSRQPRPPQGQDGFMPPPGGGDNQFQPGTTGGGFGPRPGGTQSGPDGRNPFGSQQQDRFGSPGSGGQFPPGGGDNQFRPSPMGGSDKQSGQFPGFEQGFPEKGGPGFFEEEEQPAVNPQEVSWARSEVKRLSTEIARLKKQRGMPSVASARLSELSQMISDIQSKLAGNDEDAMAEGIDLLRNENFWDVLNGIRAAAEAQQIVKNGGKSVRQAEKIAGTKSFIKSAQQVGLDLNQVLQSIRETKAAIDALKAQLDSGNLDDLSEMMQEFHEGGNNAQDITNFLMRVRDIAALYKRAMAKDQNVAAQVREMIQQAARMAAEEGYREASQFLNQFLRSSQGSR